MALERGWWPPIIMAITIIAPLPWARAAFDIAVYTLLPFGSKAVRRAASHPA